MMKRVDAAEGVDEGELLVMVSMKFEAEMSSFDELTIKSRRFQHGKRSNEIRGSYWW